MKKQFAKDPLSTTSVCIAAASMFMQNGTAIVSTQQIWPEGSTAEDAVRNITEAYQGVIESYLAHGEEIPWRSPTAPSTDETAHWVEVHA